MARRYCGDVEIDVRYDERLSNRQRDRDWYRTKVCARPRVAGGTHCWRGSVGSPVGSFRDFGVDSPEAYDEIAQSAVAFASVVAGDDEDFNSWSSDGEHASSVRQAARVAETIDYAAWCQDANGERRVSRRPGAPPGAITPKRKRQREIL
jgi:hypothetical protein